MSLRQHLIDKNYSQFNDIERERENVIKSSQGKGECNSSVLVNISKCTTFEYVFLFFLPPCSEIIDNEQRDRATKMSTRGYR